MATPEPLESTIARPSEVIYLDTSAVMAMAFRLQKQRGSTTVPSQEVTRADRLGKFLVRWSSARPVATILALEEIAAKARGLARAEILRAAHVQKWRDLVAKDPAAAKKGAEDAQKIATAVVKDAVDALVQARVVFDRPAVLAADSVKSARLLREHWQKIFANYHDLDAMDALHIVVGCELGASKFVSFDNAWKRVAEITVLH